ncbi:hypothetical protein QWZ00_00110 [Belliella kenyensis]|uniref:hypothetical protein n=1 Tax=Belliella kenyensis TaxID=1472724 RepID=UPI0025B330D1|nr:hypothetical protein [Belliella kenyensis]MDN3601520.1 hypothetical protein [Belliella kenyensis]
MTIENQRKISNIIFKGLPGALAAFGGLFLLILFFTNPYPVSRLLNGYFIEPILTPLQLTKLGTDIFSIDVENYIVFQNIESLPKISPLFSSINWSTLLIVDFVRNLIGQYFQANVFHRWSSWNYFLTHFFRIERA